MEAHVGEVAPLQTPRQVNARRRAAPRGRKLALALGVLLFAGLVAVGWRPLYVAWELRAARSRLAEGKIEAALQALQSAERFDPDRAETVYLLARAHRRADELDKATLYLERARNANWPESDLRSQRYLMLMQTGHLDRAEPYLREVLRERAEDWLAEEIYEARAKGYLSTYRLKEAALCLNFWIEWRSQAVQPRIWRADLWERIELWGAACDDYRAVLRADPSHRLARRRLAECLLNLNQSRDALEHYQICLETDPDDVEAAIGAATCRLRLGRVGEAKHHLESALRGDVTPVQRASVLVELARIALEERQIARALELLTEASELDPRNTVAQHLLGIAYARLGDDERAARHTARAKQMTERSNRFAEITRKLLITPEDADLRWEAGMILMEEGMEGDGAAWMATALVYDPYHNKTHEQLAQYYVETGDARLAAHHRAMARNARQEPPKALEAPAGGNDRLAKPSN